jgi:hypothetical protein
MTHQGSFDRTVRAWLELMPSEAPDRVIDAVLQAVDATPQQRQPVGAAFRRPLQMNRFSMAAVAVAIVLVLAGGAVVLNRATVPPAGGPTPVSSASISSAPAASAPDPLPQALQARWFGSAKALGGIAPGAGSTLLFSDSGLALTQSTQQNRPVLKAPASVVGGQLRVETGATGIPDGCTPDQAGTYGYSLSASGQTLTIRTTDDGCGARGAALAGTWWKSDCRNDGPASCLGVIDGGNYSSQYFASIGVHDVPWQPRFGSLTFTVPDGWANSSDWPNAFSLAPAADYMAAPSGQDPAAEIAVMSNAMPESLGQPCSGTPASVTSGAAAFVAWLRNASGLHVGGQSSITIDGHPAISVDLTVTSPPARLCEGTDAVYEYLMSAGWYTTPTSSTGPQFHAIGAGNRDRLILVDVPSGHVVAIVITTNDANRFDAFVQQALPIVESFRFTDAFPTP